ncbi:MAG: DUF3365 domain-containing protein [Deltaproteobacteria bacterium]|nr:DUF3365 domain-containing protein [Deltaproteobacteria bacterium]
MTRRLGWTIAALWTLAVGVSFAWSYLHERDAVRHAAAMAARAQFAKDVIYRRWNAGHGGVYVPISESSPPNPYLVQVEEREIETPSGRRLTLINPAYMTRQVHQLGLKAEGVRGHITSLGPIRPANAPDDWEQRALKGFEGGEREFSSVEMLDGEAHLRLMRPLMTEKGCLKCHAQQGYKEGEIRGGISVAIPMAPYMAISQEKIAAIGLGHCALWLFGLAGIGLGMRRIGRHIAERDRAAEALKKKTYDLGERVKELNCLFDMTQLIEMKGISLEEIIQGTVDLIQKTWQYPDITTVRIVLGDQEFKTKNFTKTDWWLASDIIVQGQLSGTVAVYYRAEKPACHEGPFLKEERSLIDTIAQRLGRIIERRRGQIELRCLKEKFEDLYHNAPIMYLSLDINGAIIHY